MQIKLGELDSILISMQSILNKELPIKIAYKFSKLQKSLLEEYKIFQENKQKLIDKYGEKDEEGNLIIKDDKIMILSQYLDAFNAEFSDFLEIEVEINFEPIKIEDLNIEITPEVLMNLDKFIIE